MTHRSPRASSATFVGRPAAFVAAALCALLLAASPASAAKPKHAAAAVPAEAASGVVNINTASVEQLTFLPGIGAERASRIVDHRASKPFKTVVELARVKGIGLKTVRNLKPWLAVEGSTTLRAPVKASRRANTKSAGQN